MERVGASSPTSTSTARTVTVGAARGPARRPGGARSTMVWADGPVEGTVTAQCSAHGVGLRQATISGSVLDRGPTHSAGSLPARAWCCTAESADGTVASTPSWSAVASPPERAAAQARCAPTPGRVRHAISAPGRDGAIRIDLEATVSATALRPTTGTKSASTPRSIWTIRPVGPGAQVERVGIDRRGSDRHDVAAAHQRRVDERHVVDQGQPGRDQHAPPPGQPGQHPHAPPGRRQAAEAEDRSQHPLLRRERQRCRGQGERGECPHHGDRAQEQHRRRSQGEALLVAVGAPLMNSSPTSADIATTEATAAMAMPIHPSSSGAVEMAATTPASTASGVMMRSATSAQGARTEAGEQPARPTGPMPGPSRTTVTAVDRPARASASRSPSVIGRVSHRSRSSQVIGEACTPTDLRAFGADR